MSFLTENWFFLLIVLLCIGMHFFHGHGHGHHSDPVRSAEAGSHHGHGGHEKDCEQGGDGHGGHGRHGCC